MTQTEYIEKIEKVESQIKACEEKLAGLKEKLKTLNKRKKEDELKEIRQRQQSIGAVVEELLSNEDGFLNRIRKQLEQCLQSGLLEISQKERCADAARREEEAQLLFMGLPFYYGCVSGIYSWDVREDHKLFGSSCRISQIQVHASFSGSDQSVYRVLCHADGVGLGARIYLFIDNNAYLHERFGVWHGKVCKTR